MTTDDPTTTAATSDRSAAEGADHPQYEIRIGGHLGPRWAAWFDGLDLTTQDDGTTVISGPVVDQAALHGLLHKLRDIGIPLVSLVQLPAGESAGPADLSNHPSSTNQPGAPS